VLAVPSIAVDRSTGPRRGRIYAAYTDGGIGGGTDNTDVLVRFSDNNGATWSLPAVVHDVFGNQASQFLPWLDVDDHSGAVAVAYYDTRSNANNQLATLYASVSVDGGTNWNEAPLATTASNQSLSNPTRYGGNYLEYIGVAMRDGTVHAVWADTRNSLGDLEMYTARAGVDSAVGLNVLSITGDPTADDVVIVRPAPLNGDYLEVLVNGVREFTGLASTLDAVTIDTGGGLDTITVTSLPAFVQLGIRAGDDADRIELISTGSPVRPVAVDAGAGDDRLLINASGGGPVLKSYANLVGPDHFAAIDVGTDATLALLASGNFAVYTRALSIAPAGTFDLFDNDLVIDYTTSTPAVAVQGWVNSARGPGGTWTGFGLTSSGARLASPPNTTLGVLEGADYIGVHGAGATFTGETVDTTMVLVKYTYYGDTDFNGFVDFDDYVRTDAGLNGGLSGWFNGDFDGSSVIDFDDYVLIDLGFNTQGPPL
jgi:hypothetical protein